MNRESKKLTIHDTRYTIHEMRVPLEWLKEFVDVKLPAERVADLLTMGGLEVEAMERQGADTIFEIGVTPNRADCLSVIGVAREVAALTKKRLRPRKTRVIKGKGRMADLIDVKVRSANGCPRYSARVISGVKIGTSPAWIIRRLVACGVRPVSNVVDATNYVMLETGQPLHAFDHRYLKGNKIIVQNPKEPFEFTTLDGETRRILSSDLLICDGEGAVALAGVMGGKNSEVVDDTAVVVLESAYFDPISIRRTGKRLGIISESSRRFERGVDPSGTVDALNRLTDIICETAGGVPTTDHVDIRSKKIAPCSVRLEESMIRRTLGVEIKLGQAKEICTRLGLRPVSHAKGALTVAIPAYRPDITRPIDVIEEIARLYGYHRIEASMPDATITPITKPRIAPKEELAREALFGCGFSEAVTYGFGSVEHHEPFASLSPAPIELTNPLSQDEAVMRTVLLPGVLKAAATNMSRQRYDVRLFTFGHVFHRPTGGKLEEPLHLAGVMTGLRKTDSWDGTKEKVDFYDAKGAVEALLNSLFLAKEALVWQRADHMNFLHPGRSAVVLVSNRRVGFVGQLHPDVAKIWDISEDCYVFEIEFGRLAQLALTERAQFSELSRFPFVERDIAILVDDKIPSVEILKVIGNSGVSLVADVRVFDLYRGKGIPEGKKSTAYTIRYAAPDRTLTDEEVNEAHTKIIKALEMELGAVLRT